MQEEKKQPKIYVLTRAYNAEHTIRRTIESVLNQSYQNFIYVIRDNGSTDNTYAICQEYALRDKRIVLVRNEKNNVYETEQDLEAIQMDWGVRYGISVEEGDYVCLLDADDEYLPEFFERAVKFAEEQLLDIVVGGSRVIQEKTKKLLQECAWKRDAVIAEEDFSKRFREYHWYLRQVWGKLYRRHTLLGMREYLLDFLEKNLGDAKKDGMSYGLDTINVLYSVQRANRIGILGGCYHSYYIQEKSVSTLFSSNRIVTDRILQKATMEFLESKSGNIDKNNKGFLQYVYFGALQDTVKCISHSAMSYEEKANALYEVFSGEYIRDFFQYAESNFVILRDKFIGDVLEKSLLPYVKHNEVCAKTAVHILNGVFQVALYTANKEEIEYIVNELPDLICPWLKKEYGEMGDILAGWFGKTHPKIKMLVEIQLVVAKMMRWPEDELLQLFFDVKKEYSQLYSLLHVEKHIFEITKKNFLLKNLSTNLLFSFLDTAKWIIKGDNQQAWNCFMQTTEIAIRDEEVSEYYLFAQILSAAVENVEAYIYFKKQWFYFLIDSGNKEEAERELCDLLEMLPEDQELIQIKMHMYP